MSSLFKRPAWAKVPNPVEEDEEDTSTSRDLFSHRDEFQDIVAEQQRRKKEREEERKQKEARKEERRKAQLERRSSLKRSADEAEDDEDRKRAVKDEPKRRRISAKDTEELLRKAGLGPIELDSDSDVEQVKSDFEVAGAATSSPQTRAARAEQRAMRTSAVSDNYDDDAVVEVSASKVQQVSPPENYDDEDDDPFFAELRRAAREQNKAKAQSKNSATPDLDGSKPGRQVSALPTPPPQYHDATVDLLITSPIPGTKPLMVKRRLAQRLQEVCEAWCTKQNFEPQMQRDVFFTFRLRRVFPSSLVRSLGLEADEDGTVYMNGPYGKEATNQIHLEAVTDDLLQELKQEKERRNRKESGLNNEDEESTEAIPTAAETIIRIILKSKKKSNELKLKVKPSTSISKIMAYCRQQWDVDPAQSLHLEFDGDQLDEAALVRDTELEDMFAIDVHIN